LIPWLDRHSPFPPLEDALREPNGLLAAGGDLSPERLLEAYRRGIFPWYSPGDPLLWWSPDPRMVLFPAELKVSRSLTKTLRNTDYEMRFDTAFAQVLEECAGDRPGAAGTWLVPEMRAAYEKLHELGHAHSVETWIEGELAGGLYGVAIGNMFYGESMFTRMRDASKIALAHLVRTLGDAGFGMIDCQMHTMHLASLGAREIARADFAAKLAELIHCGLPPGSWRQGLPGTPDSSGAQAASSCSK
jgi:leucyl/phenylalanyl-tRNA---protein transferase